MRNVEIKAKVHDMTAICKIAENISGSGPEVIKQDDTFYHVKNGRLKLRSYSDGAATLVQYQRDDQHEAKLSYYDLLQFSAEDSHRIKQLDDILKKSLGVFGRIVKERLLYMVGQTRVHIDTVQDLGHFMELEVVLRPEQSVQEGQAIANDLQVKLGIKAEDLITCAYVDLLNKKQLS